MRSQQQAERAEQQRIKNLVLNYDLRDDDSTDGDTAFSYLLQPNTNRSSFNSKSDPHNNPVRHLNDVGTSRNVSLSPSSQSASTVTDYDKTVERQQHANPTENAALESQHPYSQPRIDKAGNARNNQRARKLQLSDVDWYGNDPFSLPPEPAG